MTASPVPQPGAHRLPSGRHRLTRDAVTASQRGRLLFAVAQTVAERGYGGTTVAHVVERAGVSRSTFYEQFPDKEAAFLVAYDTGVEILLGRIRDAADELGDADWRAHVRSDLTSYMEVLAADPAFAWAMHVEVLAAGPAALERRAAIFAMFTERTRRVHELARREQPSLPPIPAEAFALHTGGIDELVRECLRTRGAHALPELAEPAAQVTFALFGAGAA